MVDLKKNKIIDLITGREKETVAEWIKKFPNLKMVSRDGSNTYRSAIELASKNIKQVSDRFHLVKLLSETIAKIIRKKYSKNIIIVTQNKNSFENSDEEFEKEYSRLSPKAKENYDKKNNIFKQIKEYYNRCNNYRKTAAKFGIDQRTVKEYAHIDRLAINKRKGHSVLDKYRDKIIDNIDKKMTDIYEIIKKAGYKGTLSNLRAYVNYKKLKISTEDRNKYVNRTNFINIIYHKGISDLGLNQEEEKNIKKFLKDDKQLSKLLKISDDFSIALFSQNPEKIYHWINEAKELNIDELNSFIQTVETDIDAIKNAITNLDISNGPVEGKNCKMKLIKRMMYGRCSTKLLRAKLLQNA